MTTRGSAHIALGLILLGCGGGAAMSASAVAKVGRGLSAHVSGVPQGAEVCLLEGALAAAPAGPEKPMAEECDKAARSDQLWRRAMLVLAAHGEKLDAVATGQNAETAGQLDAALTGVSGKDWIAVDGSEQSARDAITQLVSQMGTAPEKRNLEQVVKDAAPHVNVLCDGLVAYLETQAKGLAEAQTEIEKRRQSHSSRRCAMVDNRSICVSESVIDRMVYANVFGRIAALESSHLEARDAVAGFCAAHRKLEAAATGGKLSKDETYGEVVEAVKGVPRSQTSWEKSAKPAASEAPPSEKK